MNDLPEILTADEVADWLRLSPATVRRLAAAGEMPGLRLGAKQWRFHRDALRAWFDAKTKEAA